MSPAKPAKRKAQTWWLCKTHVCGTMVDSYGKFCPCISEFVTDPKRTKTLCKWVHVREVLPAARRGKKKGK